MKERVEILEHHVKNCLSPFLRGKPSSSVEYIVQNEIIPRMERLEIDGLLAYQFLLIPSSREKLAAALLQAGNAYVSGTFEVAPDWDSNGERGFDLICLACGNFDNHQCLLDAILDLSA